MGQSVPTIATVHAAGLMIDENGLKESQSLYISGLAFSLSVGQYLARRSAHAEPQKQC